MLGYSFTPGLANRFKAAANGQASQLPNNATQALQVLSLHLPDQLQGNPAAPDALLRGSGGLTPDTAVRAQTSGMPSPAAPSGPASMASPSLNPSPLSIATPAMSALTSQALAGPSSPPSPPIDQGAGSSPFAGTSPVDNGPAAPTGPGRTQFQFPTNVQQTIQPTAPQAPLFQGGLGKFDMPGLSDFLSAIMGGGGQGQ